MNRLFIVEQNALAVGGHYFSYTRYIADAAIRLGLKPILLLNRKFRGDWGLPADQTIPAFTFTWGEAESTARRTWGVGNLAFEYARAVAPHAPKAGDHILFHTVGFAELLALLDYLTSLPGRSDLPTYHILLRYDAGYMLNDISLFRPLFERVAGSMALCRALRFHADTDALSLAYARLSLLPFSTLPIPFDQRHLESHRTPARARDALVFAYLGDARREKGYGLLPEAIAALRGHGSSRPIRFVVQSNFSTPGGEMGMQEARETLHGMPGVELLLEPLQVETYYAHLVSADAILLPYDHKRYAARSSGILIEALAAGKPVLTSAGSWMATQVTREHAVLFDQVRGLSAALIEFADRFDDLARGAVSVSAQWRAAATGDAFVGALTTSAAPLRQPQVRKRVLVVMNGDAMVLRNGASRIALAQFDYLGRAGYAVAVVFLGYDVAALADSLEAWRKSVTESVRRFDFEAIHALVLDAAAQRFWRDDPAGPSIETDLAVHLYFTIDLALRAYLRTHPVDLVLLNYVTNLPIVDRLELHDVPIVCEMHDLQSLQKAIYGRRPPSGIDFDAEFAALARCRHLISLNTDEARKVSEVLHGMPITITGVFPSGVGDDVEVLAGCVDLVDVAVSCGAPAIPAAVADRLRPLDGIDLLFVGSNHLPNVVGLKWFLHDVFIPTLAPSGCTIVVAGSVTDYEEWPQAPGIVYLGRVPLLDPLYAASRTVMLPIFSGAGSAVKTTEALQRGKAIVATRHALRGIDPSFLVGVAIADDAKGFGDAILGLLADPRRRSISSRAIREAGKALTDPRRYYARMNEVFADVLGANTPQVVIAPQTIQTPVDPQSDFLFLAAANRIVREAIAGQRPSSTTLAAIELVPPAKLATLCEGVIDALVVKQCAPILRFDPALLRAVAGADLGRIHAEVRATVSMGK